MDARDYIKLRKDQRRRAGINDDDDDARIGSFDRYSKVCVKILLYYITIL